MAARSKKPTRGQSEAVNADAVVAAYEAQTSGTNCIGVPVSRRFPLP